MKIDETTTAATIAGHHARTRELEAAVSAAATCHRVFPSPLNRVELLVAIAELNDHIGATHRHPFAA